MFLLQLFELNFYTYYFWITVNMKPAYPLVLSVGFASYFGKVTGRIKLKSVISDCFCLVSLFL